MTNALKPDLRELSLTEIEATGGGFVNPVTAGQATWAAWQRVAKFIRKGREQAL